MAVVSRAVALLAAITGSFPVYAASCSRDWVCVDAVDQSDGGAAFRVRNLQPFPVTVTVQVRPRNLRLADSQTENPATLTVAAYATETALSFQPADANRKTGYRYWFDWAIGNMAARHDDGYRYGLPYASGERYRVVQGYGSRFSHTGNEEFTVDFDMPEGTPVHAARGGVVARVVERHDKACWASGCGRYANFIVVMHDDGTTGEYYHLRKNGAVVAQGQTVRRGQHIGFSGNTGHSTMPHLHFGVYRAAAWGKTRSLAVNFASRDGVIERPRSGPGYVAE